MDALLVIDMQVGLVTGAHREKDVVERIAALIERARSKAVPVLFMRHDHASYAPMMRGADTWQIDPRLAPRDAEPVLAKTASDSFFETSLQSELERRGVTRLTIVGMQTEFCVDTTCRSALSHGFDVTLVSDAHTTGDALLPAEQAIRHHNALLPQLSNPDHAIAVVPSADVRFAEPG